MSDEPKKRPPHLEIELDALEKAPNVARATGIAEDTAIAGLMRMWLFCWREKVLAVSTIAIRGFFGADVTAALQTFGFIAAPNAEGLYPVRGAPRLLRIQEGRSRGGHASKKNLRQYQQPPPEPDRQTEGSRPAMPAGEPAEAGRLSTGPTPALQPPTTNHQQKNLVAGTAQSATPAPDPPIATRVDRSRPQKPPDPLHAQLVSALCDAFLELRLVAYGFDGPSDAAAISRLLRRSRDVPEHVRRWKIALSTPPPRGCASLAIFAARWNEYASAQGPPRDVRRGITRAEDFDHSKQEADADGIIRIQI